MNEKITFVSRPTINNFPMQVDGRGLRELAEVTEKAEIAKDKILGEVAATKGTKCLKSFVPGELRPFIKALKVVEAAVERAANLVKINPMLFEGIEEERTRVAWKEVTVFSSESTNNLLKDAQDEQGDERNGVCPFEYDQGPRDGATYSNVQKYVASVAAYRLPL